MRLNEEYQLDSALSYKRDTILMALIPMNFHYSNYYYPAKKVNKYDELGNEILCIYYHWDNYANDYKESQKFETTYDANGNGTLRIRHFWDENANDWIGEWKVFLNFKYQSFHYCLKIYIDII